MVTMVDEPVVTPLARPPDNNKPPMPPGSDKWPQWKIDDWINQKAVVGDSNQAKPIPNGISANREKDLEVQYNGEAVEAGFAP